MSERKHTPLPWMPEGPLAEEEVCRVGGIPPRLVVAAGELNERFIIADFENEQDRDFASRACNSHYDLVEACEGLLGRLTSEYAANPHTRYDNIDEFPEVCAARAALAKAKGE